MKIDYEALENHIISLLHGAVVPMSSTIDEIADDIAHIVKDELEEEKGTWIAPGCDLQSDKVWCSKCGHEANKHYMFGWWDFCPWCGNDKTGAETEY